MTYTENITNQVKALVGTSFGHFNASKNAISNKYSIYMQGKNPDGSWGEQYMDKNYNIIADVKYNTTGKGPRYSIDDHTTGLKYTSSEPSNNNDKFNHIYIGDWVISDSNKNGVVDENDTIGWAGEGPGPLTKLGNFLQNINK